VGKISELRPFNWERLFLVAVLGMSGIDGHQKSEIVEQLQKVQESLVDIGKSLAVVVTKIDEHERRIGLLEANIK